MERSVGCARCGPSAWQGRRGWDERCSCTRRKRCYSRPGPCSRVKPLVSKQRRVVVEHRLARLVLGIRQSRYFGRTKTKFQLYLVATVANLTLVAAKVGLPADTGGDTSVGSALRTGTIRSGFCPCAARTLALLTVEIHLPDKAFRPVAASCREEACMLNPSAGIARTPRSVSSRKTFQ